LLLSRPDDVRVSTSGRLSLMMMRDVYPTQLLIFSAKKTGDF